MKKVLYITNIQVPYRVEFFNQLAQKCDLTVLYERESSDNRDTKWSKSNKDAYKKVFLDGFKTGRETSFSFRILKYILGHYDVVIIGCYNSPVQMFAMLIMRLFRRKFIISTDGELFIGESGAKNIVKKFFLRGAQAYLTAGEKSAETLKRTIGNKRIIPYYFSSLTEEELVLNAKEKVQREDFILVVGQYYSYKGLDIAVDVARSMPEIRFKFVGMGKRTELFKAECDVENVNNIEVIPFLQKDKLYDEYKKCKCLLLPTRQECWGLVVNEAASFGTPIISTYGSGAAVEFLSGTMEGLLAEKSDVNDISNAINNLKNYDNIHDILIAKSYKYSIERSVSEHMKLINM